MNSKIGQLILLDHSTALQVLAQSLSCSSYETKIVCMETFVSISKLNEKSVIKLLGAFCDFKNYADETCRFQVCFVSNCII
jgi:hypothetical protein